MAGADRERGLADTEGVTGVPVTGDPWTNRDPWTDRDLEEFSERALSWVLQYWRTGGDLPVLARCDPGSVRQRLPLHPPEAPEPLAQLLDDFESTVVPGITHWNHPGFFGYFAISSTPPSIVGELLIAALNVNAMVWRSSPAATELEEVSLRWLAELLGLPAQLFGTINDTASTSTMYALAAARHSAAPESTALGLAGGPELRVYTSTEAHSSVDKAVQTLGLGRSGLVRVPPDAQFRMDTDALIAAIETDLAAGKSPMAIVATAGTTSTSSVDPIGVVADIAERFGLWFHVDAAYGGSAAVLPERRRLLRGWERADSIVVNPHKWLFVSIDCSVLYVRDRESLKAAFSLTPEYLKTDEDGRVIHLMDYGLALGRRFRALKLWFVLRAYGASGIRQRIAAHIEMARHFASWVDEEEGWRRAAPVPFSLVVFRYEGGGPDASVSAASNAAADDLNRRILNRVNESGEAFLSHTVLGGQTWLRLAVGNARTRLAHVERAWVLLREAAAAEGS